jgi:hypothetical protein
MEQPCKTDAEMMQFWLWRRVGKRLQSTSEYFLVPFGTFEYLILFFAGSTRDDKAALMQK